MLGSLVFEGVVLEFFGERQFPVHSGKYYARIIGAEEPFVVQIRCVDGSDSLVNLDLLISCVVQELEVDSFFKID